MLVKLEFKHHYIVFNNGKIDAVRFLDINHAIEAIENYPKNKGLKIHKINEFTYEGKIDNKIVTIKKFKV